MEDDIYTQNILDRYKNPTHKGECDVCDIRQEGVNPICGDKLTLCVVFEEDKVKSATFEGEGCAISIAAADMLAEKMIGVTKAKLRLITPGDIYSMLGITIGPSRSNCALLAYKALQDGLKNN